MRTREKLSKIKIIEKEVCALDFAIACLNELKKGFIEDANELSIATKKTEKKAVKKAKKSEVVKKAKAEKPVKKVAKKTKRSK